jgi:hypothetical protein
MIKKFNKISILCAISVFLIISVSWAAGYSMPKSGFLQDYSLLGKDNMMKKADKIYINKKTDFEKYDQIMLDDIVFMIADEAKFKGFEAKELADLADAFSKAIMMNLAGLYEFTDKPGPGVMRLRVALTNLNPNNPVTGTITTIIPVGILASGVKKGATGDHIGMGEVSFEGEMIDSQSGEILAAVMDAESGKKYKVTKSVSKWGHTVDIFNKWAQTLRKRLDKLTGRE